jgi:hypothetical protein
VKNLFRITGVISLMILIHACEEEPSLPKITTTEVIIISYISATSGWDATSDGEALLNFMRKMPIIEDFIIMRARWEDTMLLKRLAYLFAVSRTENHKS